MKAIFFIAIAFLFLWGANELYQKKNRSGLQTKFASPTFSSSSEWELPPLSPEKQEEVYQILSQPFTFFARGSQAVAFISEDKQYIVKLFKQHKWRPKHILGHVPLPFNPYYKDFKKNQEKQWAVLRSCRTALTHVKEDTGVLYAHLNPTPFPLSTKTFIDKKGKKWQLDLSKSCFLLQKKADLFYPHIEALMDRGDIEAAKYAISSTLDLLRRFMDMGVFENNAILRKNFGFIDNRAMQFDIGKFQFDEHHKGNPKEIRSVTERFHVWVERNYPELLPHFDQKLMEVAS